jgi:hypothetical protein
VSNRYTKGRQIIRRPKVCLTPKPIPLPEPHGPCTWICQSPFPGIYFWQNIVGNCVLPSLCIPPTETCDVAHVGDIAYTECS